jgi:hypothetical protein
MEKSVDNDFTFDFSGKKQDNQRREELKQKVEKFNSFKKMGIFATASVLSVALIGFGGKAIYDNVQKATDNSIAEKVLIIQATPKIKIVELIERERDVVKSTFAKNQVLLNNYANYKELVDVLTLNSSVSSKQNANNKLQKETLALLDYDQKAVDKVVYALTESRDVKKDVLLSGDAMSKFTKWTVNVKNNEFMYAGGMIALGKDIDKELKFLDDTQKDIMKTVQDKIKAKDFNLDKAQSELNSQVSKDASSEISDLRKVQNELAGTDQSSMLTDRDVAQAENAMSDLQKEAAAKIKQDRETVEKMIASVNSPAQVNTAQPTQNNQGNTQAQNSNKWGFAEYYLLYSWLNSGSNNNNSYNSGYNAGVNAQYNRSMPTPTAAILSRGSANMYSIKKENSYLNQSINRRPIERVNGITVERPNINLIRAQMDLAKQKAQQAVVARQQDVARKAETSRRIESARAESIRKDKAEASRVESSKSSINSNKDSKLSQGATSSGSSSGSRTYTSTYKSSGSSSGSRSSSSSRRK